MKPIEHYIEIRQQLHAHPDVSGCEQYAHDLVVSELHGLNPDELYEHVGGYGVVAVWYASENEKRGQTIAFRADIDALPIGHRCGHDGHTAVMLRFAERTASCSERPYNVMIIFQPEEETGNGARKIVDSGLLQKHHVAAIFGMHNMPGIGKGTVVLNRGTFAAASTGVIYTLTGRETHASTPEKGLNPGLAVAEIIKQIDTLNNEESFGTLICVRVGEEAFGTSAGKGEVMFTLRAFTNDAMLLLVERACLIVEEIANREGLKLEIEYREPFKATENTPELVDQIENILTNQPSDKHCLMQAAVPILKRSHSERWSEDFAEYLQVVPGAFFGMGSGTNQPELHHPEYNFPDDIIESAASVFELIMKNIQL